MIPRKLAGAANLTASMEFGVSYFPTQYGMPPGAVARLVEDYGMTALFATKSLNCAMRLSVSAGNGSAA